MPVYLYKNEETGEVKEVVQKMNDEHVYIEDEIEWKRVYINPNMAMDTKIDPFSKQQFVDKTKSVKTLGEAWDMSKEMSEARKEKIGKKDPIRENAEKRFWLKGDERKQTKKAT